MNLNIFTEPLDEDWEITDSQADMQAVYDQILYEIKEDDGNAGKHCVALDEKTVYWILVLLKGRVSSAQADTEVVEDLKRLILKEQ